MARGPFAAKRGNVVDVTAYPAQSAPPSNQAKSVDRGSIQRTVGVGVNEKRDGDVVKLAGNDKGTGVVGRPVALGQASKDYTLSGVENPDGVSNRPGSRRK